VIVSDETLHVRPVQERLPNLGLGERLTPGVDEDLHEADRMSLQQPDPASSHQRVHLLRQEIRDDVDRAGQEPAKALLRVRDELEHDSGNPRRPSVVVGKGREGRLLRREPRQPKRAQAYRVSEEVALGPPSKLVRHDHAELGQPGRQQNVGTLGDDPDGHGIHSDDLSQLAELVAPGRVDLRVQDPSEGIDDVRRRELASVMEANPSAERELPGQRVDGSPPLEERRAELAVGIAVDQRLEDQPEEALRLRAVDLEGVQHFRGGGRVGDHKLGPMADSRGLRDRGRQEGCRQAQRDDPAMNHGCHMANLLSSGTASDPAVSDGGGCNGGATPGTRSEGPIRQPVCRQIESTSPVLEP
jgi:hypothetical protein